MRIAEKTVELNFCAQANAACRRRLIWFGLTQRQEAQAGFDACTKHNGRLLIFQFKASNFSVGPTTRRFYASHDQMVALQKRCSPYWRSVFYVFPLIGTTFELTTQPNLLSVSWLLDVAALPNPIPRPTKRGGGLRRSGIHYVDVTPGGATIHSNPFAVGLMSAQTLFAEGLPGADGVSAAFGRDFGAFWEKRQLFQRAAIGVAVLNG
jgi:hypothetical protein